MKKIDDDIDTPSDLLSVVLREVGKRILESLDVTR